MDIFDIIILLCIGYFIGQAHTMWKLRAALRNLAEELNIDFSSHIEPDEVEVVKTVRMFRTEKIKDTLYLYDTETDGFICQALTLKELAQQIHKMDSIKVAGVIDGDKKCWFVNGNVYDTLDEIDAK